MNVQDVPGQTARTPRRQILPENVKKKTIYMEQLFVNMLTSENITSEDICYIHIQGPTLN
jgi:hypothetical protein